MNYDYKSVIPYKASFIASEYARQHETSELSALEMFYASQVYERLCDKNTGYWKMGGTALYDEFEKEMLTN